MIRLSYKLSKEELQMKTQADMIIEEGFEKVDTQEVMAKIAEKTTKVAQEVSRKMADSEYYDIFVSGDRITVISRWMVTKQEQTQLKRVLGKKEFIESGALFKDNDKRWLEWIDYKGCRTGRA
jgi:hypothetical protein